MRTLYPLKFHPYPQFLRFGGTALLHRLPHGERDSSEPLAETWEVSGHPRHGSSVASGPLEGLTIPDLMRIYGKELIGPEYVYRDGHIFPLMLRFLDCRESLPPAVHPDSSYVKKAGLLEGEKTEAWYVLNADENAVVYCGNRPELNSVNVSDIAVQGKIFDYLKSYSSKQGDVFLVPPGRPHSIGAGNVIYEIQQTSNAIFPFDWLAWQDKDQKRRDSDLYHACQCAVFEKGNNDKITAVKVKDDINKLDILTVSKYFALEKYTLREREEVCFRKPHFSIITCIVGRVLITSKDAPLLSTELNEGQTALIPAIVNPFAMIPETESSVLCAYVPDIADEIIYPLKGLGYCMADIYRLGGYGSHNPF